MAADRGAFICQSQSLNLFIQDPNFGKLTSMHFYAWEKGLKTGMYYLRTKAAADAIKFTVDHAAIEAPKHPETSKEENVAPSSDLASDNSPQDLFSVPTNESKAQEFEAESESQMAMAQITCSLDDPEGCEMCGS